MVRMFAHVFDSSIYTVCTTYNQRITHEYYLVVIGAVLTLSLGSGATAGRSHVEKRYHRSTVLLMRRWRLPRRVFCGCTPLHG